MYHTLARNILTNILSGKPIPSLSELWIIDHSDLQTKHLVFITLYQNGAIIASSGRVHNKKENTILECIDACVEVLNDPRLVPGLLTQETLLHTQIRVDIIESWNRRVLAAYTEIDPKDEGYIFLSQNLGKLAVLLPGIIGADKTTEQLFQVVCKKASVDPSLLQSGDYVLYGIKSEVFSDF